MSEKTTGKTAGKTTGAKASRKTLGICPCCGSEYAVLERTIGMSKHGKKVNKEWAFLSGVCLGEGVPPVEICREAADAAVQRARQAAERCAVAADGQAGELAKFADFLSAQIERFHGQPLREVVA